MSFDTQKQVDHLFAEIKRLKEIKLQRLLKEDVEEEQVEEQENENRPENYKTEVDILKEQQKNKNKNNSSSVKIGVFWSSNETKWIKKLPLHPKRPTDCCGNGCTPCVFDAYRDELEVYQTRCQQIEEEYLKRTINMTMMRTASNFESASCSTHQDFILETVATTQFLAPYEYRSFTISSIEKKLNHHQKTLRIVLALPGNHPERQLNVDFNHHLFISQQINGKNVTRAYTPTHHPHHFQTFELTIKISGELSEYLANHKQVGDSLSIRGPIPNRYKFVHGKSNHYLFLAAGSGITPLYQFLLQIEGKQPIYPTKVTLFYTCSYLQDFWKVGQLKEIADRSEGWIQVYFWISRQEKNNMSHSVVENGHEKFDLNDYGECIEGDDNKNKTKTILGNKHLRLQDIQEKLDFYIHGQHPQYHKENAINNTIVSIYQGEKLDPLTVLICGPSSFVSDMQYAFKSLKSENQYFQIDSVHVL